MSNLQVMFEVPRAIQAGLASGQLQRVGGVIVNSDTRQIVTWLRDSNALGDVVGSAINATNPLGAVLEAAKLGASLYDGHLTRQSINALSSSVAALSNSVNLLAQVTIAGQLLNLGFSAVTFHVITKRIDALSNDIEALSKRVSAEFRRDRDTAFKGALRVARNVFEDKTLKETDVSLAIKGLYEAREDFLKDFNETVKRAETFDELLMAQHYLIRAFFAMTTEIQCYFQGYGAEFALKRLREDKPILEKAVETLIKRWQGEKPAIYFHKDIEPEYLDRFFAIEQWLRQKHYSNNPLVMFEIVNDMRSSFWDMTLLDQDMFKKLTGRGGEIAEDTKIRLAKNLHQAEILIENMERFYGFELEIAQTRLSDEAWDELVDQDMLDEYGSVLIIDTDALSHLEMEI